MASQSRRSQLELILGLFKGTFSTTYVRIASNGRMIMNNGLEKVEIVYHCLPGGTEENLEEPHYVWSPG
jgi:hypothetical protein